MTSTNTLVEEGMTVPKWQGHRSAWFSK